MIKKALRKKKPFNKAKPSELRMDLVSNDWVVIATGRARRPESFAKHQRIEPVVSSQDCPFCQPEILDLAIEKRNRPDGSWLVISIPNKFPAFSQGDGRLNKRKEGPNQVMDGYGFHEVIITDDHQKPLALFNQEEFKQVIDLYQSRYLDLIRQPLIRYVSLFHNHGQEAGASVAHPHSQIIAIPVIDPDLRSSLDGAEAFYRSQGQCVYCTMIDWDLKDGQRIIYENERFVVLLPFAPQVSFETRVYPKEHQPFFGQISAKDKELLAEAFQQALSKIYHGLKDPALNFYLHTAPDDSPRTYNHYHWHINILPKTATWAGFELGAGIEISTVEPEKAAQFLRKF